MGMQEGNVFGPIKMYVHSMRCPWDDPDCNTCSCSCAYETGTKESDQSGYRACYGRRCSKTNYAIPINSLGRTRTKNTIQTSQHGQKWRFPQIWLKYLK